MHIICIEILRSLRAQLGSSKREQNRPNERPNGLRCSGEKLEKSPTLQLAGELGFDPACCQISEAPRISVQPKYFVGALWEQVKRIGEQGTRFVIARTRGLAFTNSDAKPMLGQTAIEE